MTTQSCHTISLGKAITATVEVSPTGLRLVDLRLSPGASVTLRRPGRLRGRWPARSLDLAVDETGGDVYVHRGLRVRPQEDGSWQVGVLEQWAADPDLSVTTPVGMVHVARVGDGLDARASAVTAGWGVRTLQEDRDARVTLTGDGEVWEVHAMVDDAGRWPFVIAREHRWVIDPA
jgi:hypothetical protein